MASTALRPSKQQKEHFNNLVKRLRTDTALQQLILKIIREEGSAMLFTKTCLEKLSERMVSENIGPERLIGCDFYLLRFGESSNYIKQFRVLRWQLFLWHYMILVLNDVVYPFCLRGDSFWLW
jgi:hypothetical protein